MENFCDSNSENGDLPQMQDVQIKGLPLSELKNGNFQLKAGSENGNSDSGLSGKKRKGETKGRTKTPQAVAVARRNARERNRVKQVNNGFAALRQHIPNEIAEVFEQGGSKNATKKLSKVETLRMAVEYIRQLEGMLTSDSSFSTSSSSESYLPATPPPEQQQSCFYAIKPTPKYTETQIAIINGQQYVRIPGTNTFQLLAQDLAENEENMKPDDFPVLPAGTIIQQSSLAMPESSDPVKQEPNTLANITNSFAAFNPSILQNIKTEDIMSELVDPNLVFGSRIRAQLSLQRVACEDLQSNLEDDDLLDDDSGSWNDMMDN